MRERIQIIGPGRLGLALGLAFTAEDSVESLVVVGRGEGPPHHPLFESGVAEYRSGRVAPDPGTTALLLTVPDGALRSVAGELAAAGPHASPCPVFHASGALGLDVLDPLHAAGWPIGGFHPLLPIGNPVTSADRLHGAWFALAGEVEAMAVARRLLRILAGHELRIPASRRPLYHAAAATGSYHLQAVLLSAVRLMETLGVPADDALHAILSLARGALSNLEELPAEQALTGPIVRGDVETIRLHLLTLEPREQRLYRPLAQAVLDLVPFGGDAEDLTRLERLLEEAPGPTDGD